MAGFSSNDGQGNGTGRRPTSLLGTAARATPYVVTAASAGFLVDQFVGSGGVTDTFVGDNTAAAIHDVAQGTKGWLTDQWHHWVQPGMEAYWDMLQSGNPWAVGGTALLGTVAAFGLLTGNYTTRGLLGNLATGTGRLINLAALGVAMTGALAGISYDDADVAARNNAPGVETSEGATPQVQGPALTYG